MVWAAASINGLIDLVVMERRQNSADYIDLVNIQKINFNEIFEGRQWIFQQDNATIHTAGRVKQ